jgi:hypothetical protein
MTRLPVGFRTRQRLTGNMAKQPLMASDALKLQLHAGYLSPGRC